jgi:hypothetical protein
LIHRHFSWAILTGGSDGVRACANDLGEGCSAIEADRVGAMDAVEHAADLAGGVGKAKPAGERLKAVAHERAQEGAGGVVALCALCLLARRRARLCRHHRPGRAAAAAGGRVGFWAGART